MSSKARARRCASGPLCSAAGAELDERRRTAAARRASNRPAPAAPWGTDQPRRQLVAIATSDAELLARLEAEASTTPSFEERR